MTTDDDFKRLESKVDKLTDAVMRLVLIEERQSTQGERIGRLEIKAGSIETSQIKTENKLDQWVNRGIGIWVTVGAVWAILNFLVTVGAVWAILNFLVKR